MGKATRQNFWRTHDNWAVFMVFTGHWIVYCKANVNICPYAFIMAGCNHISWSSLQLLASVWYVLSKQGFCAFSAFIRWNWHDQKHTHTYKDILFGKLLVSPLKHRKVTVENKRREGGVGVLRDLPWHTDWLSNEGAFVEVLLRFINFPIHNVSVRHMLK